MTTRVPRLRGQTSRQWRDLLAVLAEQTSYRSAAELFADLRTRGHRIGLVTVYRHLETMHRNGIVATMPGRRGETRYRLHPSTGGDRHPLVCTRCRRVVDVDAGDVTRWAETTAVEHGFTDVRITVLATGVCGRCR